MSLADDLKKQTKNFRMKKIDYQVDTIRIGQGANSFAGGYYSPADGTITLNHIEDDELARNLAQDSRETILYHEQKHRSNANKGFQSEDIDVSPEQYYKLCMADEISANMAALVHLREKYIQTGDIHLFDKDGKFFSFYKEAVQKGEVNPLSSDPKDFEKDMSLIMNGTQKMWLNEFADMYSEDCLLMTNSYLCSGNKDFKKNDAEYQKQLDIAYTIGGVNFKQYMQEDMEIPNNLRTQDSLDKFDFIEKMEKFPFKGNMSFEQYGNLLQHLYIANMVRKSSEQELDRFNVDKVDNLNADQRQEYLAHMKECTEDAKNIMVSRVYKHKEAIEAIEAINIGLSRALKKQGELVAIPSDNETNYQAALKQVYHVNGVDYYSLLSVDPQEKMPLENYVKEFEKTNPFTQSVDKVSGWNVSAWDKIVNLFKKNRNSKKHLENYPEWSEDKRVSEIQYEKIIDLDKPVITGRPKRKAGSEQVRPSQSAASKTADGASQASKETPKQENRDRAAYLKSLSGRTQQGSSVRISPSFSQMRDNKSRIEMMLLRRQLGR